MRERRTVAPLWLLIVFVTLACVREDGPAPVAWDRERCARCGMLISDPAFAAQRHDADGDVHHFDDPGCLLVSLDDASGSAERRETLYFHHAREDRWLRGDEVGFSGEAGHTPMGYGLAAIAAADDASSLSLVEAQRRARDRDRERKREQP